MSEPIENPIEPIEPQPQPQNLENPANEGNNGGKNSFDYDRNFIDELTEKVEKKLEKKLYYGRKQEKQDKKAAAQIEIDKESYTISDVLFNTFMGILILTGGYLAYLGFLNQNKGNSNENNA